MTDIVWDKVKWDDEDPSYASRVISEGLPAVANMGMDIARSVPAGLAGIGSGIAAGLSGENGMNAAAETFGNVMQSSKDAMPGFTGPGAQRGGEALSDMMEKGVGFVGDIGESLGNPLGNVATNPETGSPLGRTLAEAATNFLPIPGTKLVRRIPHIGSDWKLAAARSAEQAKLAEGFLQEKMKIDKALEERMAYDKAYAEIDNTQRPYGRDLQAPQLGQGGKLARHEDQGKSEYTRVRADRNAAQEAFDADMARLGNEYDVQRMKDENTARFVNSWHPEVDLPQRPKPNLIGPNAKSIERADTPEEIAQSVRENMRTKSDFTPPPDRLDTEGKQREAQIATDIARETKARMNSSSELSGGEAVGSKGPTTPGFNDSLVEHQTKGSSVRDMLESIRDNSQIPYYKELSKLLLNDPTFNPRFSLVDSIPEGKGQGWQGIYNPKDYKISLLTEHVGQESLMLHEAVHARTHGAINGVDYSLPGTNHLRPAVARLNDLYNNFKSSGIESDKWRSILSSYGISNIHEFIAEGFTNPEFQSLLARTPLQKGMHTGNFKLYWDMFVDRIGKLLGFNNKTQNYLSELMKAGADIMHGADSDIRRLYDKTEGAWQGVGAKSVGGYSLKEFQTDLKDKGFILAPEVAKSLWEKQQVAKPEKTSGSTLEPTIKVTSKIPGLVKLQREVMETSSLEDMKDEITAASNRDIGIIGANGISKIINGDYMAKDHPLLSWTSSKINQIKNKYTYEANQLLHGDSKKNPSPGSYNYEWSKLSIEDRVAVNDVGQALNNSQTRLSNEAIQAIAVKLTGRMFTERQMQSYHDRLVINKQVLQKINAFLLAEKKEPINELPHYWSPAEFEGKFLTIIKDPITGSKIVRGTYFKPSLDKLQKEFPGLDISEPIERDSRAIFNMEQYIDLLRNLNKELRDPATRALAESIRRRGILRHGLKREGVPGSLGTEGGRTGLDSYEAVSEKYIRKAHEYLGSREIDKVYNELLNFEPAKKSPYAHSYALESLDQARGGMNATMQALSEGMGKIAAGLVEGATLGKVIPPSSIIRDAIRPANQIKSTLLLGFLNPQFMAANMIQSSYAFPKMLGMAAEYGNRGLISTPILATKALIKTWVTMLDQNHPDIKKLGDIGTFEATMRYDWSSYASDAVKFKNNLKDHLSGMSMNAAIESHAVRKPAALMFLNMLRELDYDSIARNPNEIYELTKNLTEDYMVSMQRHKKPHIFGRTGLLGTATGPLQSFTTTWIAQLREYIKQSGKTLENPANALPLGSFLALNLVTAGLTGMVGVKEWDVTADFLNKQFNMNIPTGTETILKVAKSDKLRFGVLSDAIGMHIGSTFGAPTMQGAGAPGVGFLVDIGQVLWRGLKETGALGEMSKPTEAEKRDSWKAVTPRSWAWGNIEEAYTPKGAPTQTSKGIGGPYTRTERDQTIRKLGMYSLDEVKGKIAEYPVERQIAHRQERLKTSAGLMVDSMLNGEKPVERMSALITELQKDSYSAKDIRAALGEQLRAKVTEKDVRLMGHGTTTRQKLIIQMFNELK